MVKNKVNRTTVALPFYSSYHHKWLSYQILGSKTVKNVQIDPQTTEIWLKWLFVTLSVKELSHSQREAELLVRNLRVIIKDLLKK